MGKNCHPALLPNNWLQCEVGKAKPTVFPVGETFLKQTLRLVFKARALHWSNVTAGPESFLYTGPD